MNTNTAPSPTDARATEWILPPFFMLRLAGLPFDTVAPLRFPQTVAWTQAMLEVEQRLREGAPPVLDALEAVISEVAGQTERGRLIEIRRDVYNGRAPRQPAEAIALVGRHAPQAGPALAGWLAAHDELARIRATGAQILADEQLDRQRHLRELATHPQFRAGLLLSSPSLDRYLPTFLSNPAGPLGKRARRIERSLLEYVYRTACKTSPFSWLTPVGLGRFTQGSGDPLIVETAPEQWRSFPRLNLAVLGRLGDTLLAEPALRADLPIQVTSGWRNDRNRVRYVRRQRRAGDDDAAGSMDILQENLFYLTSGTVLTELLETIPDGTSLTFGELVTRLHDNDPEHRRPADIDAYLVHLLRLGLLVVPQLHIDLHHPDPVRGFRDGLAQLGRGWSAEVCERLDLVSGYVREYAHADLDRRRDLLEAIRGELAEGQHDLGRAEATLPRTVLYEDVSLGAGRVTADEAQWREKILPAAAGLSKILPVFDLMLPHRLTAKGFFRARFGPGGRCTDLVRLVHEFHQDFYDQFLESTARRRPFNEQLEYQPQENWFQLAEITALDKARVELVRRMREAYAAHPDPAADLVLDDDFMDGVAELLPDNINELNPRSFFLHLAEIDGRPQAVLNRAYSGLTLLFSRFAHCFADGGEVEHGLVEGLKATLAQLAPPGAVFAELTGGYDTTNLNLHPSVVPYQLVCPGDVSFRPVAEQIPVDDLVIEDDVEGDRLRLRSQRLGVEVIPVYLGFLMPMALPEVQRILLTFSYTNMSAIDMWSGTDQPLGDDEIGGHPRLVYKDLVLTRRLWKMDPASLPVRGAGQSDADWFLDWNRWARKHGLPRRVFASQDASAPAVRKPGAPAGPPPSTKPQYVDFDSFMSLSLLDNMIKSAGRRVVLTEMLPDAEHLWVRADGNRWVTELTVEIDGRRSNR
ncbi:lantibiotic dehydratase [Catellatospora coxensis]|uniref:Lanthionine biosynthesis protein n=1 Tax=Catellatospora coxensis TaxID=310354 RepID=A0A8J3P5U3_9ACTN|nr:lantibiotic dehydratase [Catellatospora coxensis]GIG05103.1 lanthionine biosynthesis protein [Catellatospora coxensis]